MTVSLIGGHMTRNGIERNYPARVALSINGNGLDEQHADTIILFRDITVYNDGPPDLHTHPQRRTIEYARWWYNERTDGPRLRDVWTANKHRAHYFTITNELGGSDAEHIKDHIAYEANICQLAAVDGLKCAVGKLAGDSPNWPSGLWQQLYAPFIVDMWTRYGAIYARHAYGGNLVDGDGKPTHDQPGNPSRPFDEVDHLRTLGYGGGMVLAECGLDGGYGLADYARFREQALGYAAALKPHADMVIGLCWYECGQTGFNANYTNHLKQIKGELDVSLPKWTATAVPPDPPTPPDGDYKSVVFVAAQEHTKEQYLTIAGQAFDEYGRTLTRSGDNAKVMVGDGNDQSYGVIFDPDLPSQKAVIDLFDDNGLAYQTRYLSGNPLDGLRLGHLFRFAYQYTSRFNDDRDYDGDRVFDDPHEGTDNDFIGGKTNNTEMVLATYDGVVERSVDSTGNYGKYVRIRHERNGKPFLTWYCHLDSRAVQEGQTVTQGQPVGEIGTSGNVTGEHVHFNLVVPGFGATPPPGKSPYAITDVVDPAPYLPTAAEMAALPPVPTTQQIDMSLYFYPPGGGTHSDIFTLANNWGQGPERCQLQRAGSVSYVTKNAAFEKRTVGNTTIALNLDTSPGNGEYYTVDSPTGWMPRMWSPGQSFNRQETTKFYKKDGCAFLRQSNWSTPLKFEAVHAEWTSQAGIRLANVAELSWFANGRIDERYWFAPGLGLVGWQKYDGKKSWVSEIIPRGQQADNVRESGCFGA